MLRFIAAVMTGGACAFLGLRLRLVMKTRAKSLADILTSLELLESEIDFGMNRLSNALNRADTNGLLALAAGLVEECGAKKAWENAVTDMREKLCLTDADCEAVMLLGASMGKTDSAEQVKHIRYVKSLTAAQKEQAQSEYERAAKLYSTGGVLIGALVVVILW